jgi:hypothetical protein
MTTELSRYRILLDDDSVQIIGPSKDEELYWDKQEWIDDPQVVPTIVNAVRMALSEPDKFRDVMKTLKTIGE